MQQQARVVPPAVAVAGVQAGDGYVTGFRGVRAGGRVRRYRFRPDSVRFMGRHEEDLSEYPTADWLDLEFERRRSPFNGPYKIRVHAKLYAYASRHVFLARRTTQMSRALMSKCVAWCQQNDITDEHQAYKLATDVVAACQYLTPAEIKYQEIVGTCSLTEHYDVAQQVAAGQVKLRADLKQRLTVIMQVLRYAVEIGIFLAIAYTATSVLAAVTSSAALAGWIMWAFGGYVSYSYTNDLIDLYNRGWGYRVVADK